MKVVRVILTNAGRLARLGLITAVGAVTLATSLVVIAPKVAEIAAAHRFERGSIDLGGLSERSYVYDVNGNLMATFVAEENREFVGIEKVPRTVVDSVLAAEDSAFYSHNGVNARSIGRAFTANLESGGVDQGGSTITQQVVKNSIGDKDQDFARKIREAVLATELEEQYTKDEILERYLNTVYFGAGAYGVQAAAGVYFNKDVSELTWSEGAMLAGVIRCPVSCDPFKRRSRAFSRRNTVLDSLIATGRLDREVADVAKFDPIPTEANEPRAPQDYFVEEVRRQLLEDERLGGTPTARYNRLYGGGLRVYTTFDQAKYFKALEARNTTLPNNSGDATFPLPPDPITGARRFGTAAMAAVDPRTGAVPFVVGGPGFDRYEFDLAIQGKRQVGSSFKVFVLTQAILDGASPDDTVDGTGPCGDVPGYGEDPPDNFGGSRGAVTTLRRQILTSSNCAFLRLNQIVGPQKVADLAHRMGVTSTLNPENASMALGTNDISPLEMASAYSVLANDGIRNPPYFIDRVEDIDGRIVLAHQARPERVLPTNVARLVTDVLESNVESGTGSRAAPDNGQPAAGKTGTTNDAKDIWFVGYTPRLAMAVWMGATVGGVRLSFGGGDAQGGRYPAATWGAAMSLIAQGEPIEQFPEPEPVDGLGRLCFRDPDRPSSCLRRPRR
ncbi:MAG TPA: transglycosylase domain-containing protein [Acidimicrobiales bacterium]|nr:transglycosylase domain-containing protein [Acidimicrobiales bacterium]